VGYTYSKAIDQTGDSSSTFSIQDNACHSCERSVSEQNETHNFTENTMYELPFGHNHKFLNSGLPAVLSGGWQLGDAYKYSSGIPVQLTESASSTPSTLIGAGVIRPSIVSGVSLAPTSSTQAFNPAAFAVTPNYKFGNAPRYESQIHYPDYQNLDVFLQKQTKFWGERLGVTIRFEALNALNSVVFGAPGANVSSPSSFGLKSTTQTNSPREAQLSARFTF
jgi:hypothetical protein